MIEQSKDCQSVFPKNHLYKILLDNKIFFDDSDEKNPFSYYYCKENECAVRETNKVFNGLGKIALLFRALKDNKYIYLIDSGEKKHVYPAPDNRIIEGYRKESLIRVNRKLDENLAEYFRDCFNNSIGISPKLIEMYNKDFKTVDELIVEEEKKRTMLNRIVAVFKVVGSLIKFGG